ncbi:MAG TPA: DNA mismatch repair endonuclease MutL [Oligoflexia bacterium]|nr:DNA mismatch repair endonuclease MutL [Oligoflexia bacterium]HMP49150.1 DNA mismatch repair endonuclease MutL [Oligoflexia bacterium]
MDSISLLEDTLVNQIAAGEVIERPSSVVKELIENSIDAGASKISISIKNGGLSHIEVLDDGIGMSKADIVRSVQRFATSKISTLDDLSNILTYGFRGEALPSIASVSRLIVTSRARNSSQAYQIRVEGGDHLESLELSALEGTRIRVSDLFYNVPARRKFLKSERSEGTSIRGVVSDFALSHPEIGFSLYDDAREVLLFPYAQSLRDRVSATRIINGEPVVIPGFQNQIDSKEPVSNYSPPGIINIWGLLSQPLHCVRGGSRLRFFLNGRIIKSPLILRAIRDGYGSLLKPGTYPTGVLNILVNPSEVDVNVHPQKTEVRFRFDSSVFSAVRSAVIGSLVDTSEKVRSGKPYLVTQNPVMFNSSNRKFQFKTNIVDQIQFQNNNVLVNEFLEKDVTLNSAKDINELTNILNLRFVGQLFKLYLVFEDNNDKRALIVDMHAAHERITFFNLKSSYLENNIIKQDLLLPISIPVSEFENYDNIENKVKELEAFGIEIELRGIDLLIRSIPYLISQDGASELVRELLSDSPESGFNTTIETKIDSYLARIACHGSIRRGRIINAEEAYSLIESLEKVHHSGWCPHGRPVVWWLSENELESRFGRSFSSTSHNLFPTTSISPLSEPLSVKSESVRKNPSHL